MKRIVVQCDQEWIQVGLLADGELIEYAVESPRERQMTGSVYLGRVVNVLPGMQAAFVDIGLGKNAFLYIDDALPANLEKQPKVKPSIEDMVRPGQEIMVQVSKEPVGTKGARVTTHFSIPGRWLVYMPNADYIGISRKIEEEAERDRLRDVCDRLRAPGEGFIVRTAAAEQSEAALAQDIAMLRETWLSIKEGANGKTAPCCLYQDVDVIARIVRDMFAGDVEQLVVDNRKRHEEIVRLLGANDPHLVERVVLEQGAGTVFDAYGVSLQLDKLFRPKIWLNSGGYLVFDQTEALTVIDVNTGKYTGSTDLEDTVFHTNLEAAEMIARLIRLRDIGGIIIVDFIDMKLEEHRKRIVDSLETIMQRDRTKSIVVGWTKLGLLEITRKKVRSSRESFMEVCSACGGSGRVPAHRARHGGRGGAE